MAETEAFVWHDLDGNITAVGHQMPGSERIIEPIVSDDRRVLKLRIATEYLAELHLTHVVDIENAKITRR